MIHVTLTTGHSRFSPRDEVDQGLLGFCQDHLLGRLGRGLVPLPSGIGDYAISATAEGSALVATAWSIDGQRSPLATWWTAPDSEAVEILGPNIAMYCRRLIAQGLMSDCPPLPTTLPWCAVALDVGIALDQSAGHWLGDLERCVAWAWIDQCRKR